MKPFLGQLAEKLFDKYGYDFQDVTLVFPNRRAGLFFRKYLSAHLKKPLWAPQILNIDEFIKGLSPIQTADNLTLLFLLFHSYKTINPITESFDQFYHWGEMLLRDFDEIDKYLVNPKDLFKNLKDQKELESHFDFLTPEQLQVIQQFWASFQGRKSRHQEGFLQIWDMLPKVYSAFKQDLLSRDIGYDGMIFRMVAENIQSNPVLENNRKIIFAGFNALTRAEEIIIAAALEKTDAEMHWDLDSYYFYNSDQEAGHFLRKYSRHKVFAKTFPKEIPNDLQISPKKLELIGVPLAVGQAKLLGEMLTRHIKINAGEPPEKTAIVLPDEQMLFPVLHSLPADIEDINITMGYPLRDTPLFGLIEHLLDFQQNVNTREAGNNSFYYKVVVNLLKHPYVYRFDPQKASAILDEIKKNNRINIEFDELRGNSLYETIFQRLNSAEEVFDYLLDILTRINSFLMEGDQEREVVMEKEFVFHFYTQIKRLKEVILQQQVDFTLQTFLKLFRQIIYSMKLPFSGEPLNGLQIMGVLETRNLDFDDVYMLSMNEGQFPPSSAQTSFIPYNLRKGYGLPTFEQQESIYAYNFYRLIQRARRVHLFYNTESSIQTGGEMSRFLNQLRYEAPFEVNERILSNPIKVPFPVAIVINKNESVLEGLSLYLEDVNGKSAKALTPSAFNTYLDCSLKFYFRYVVRMYESAAIEEEIDAPIFGNLLHNTMEFFYKLIIDKNGHSSIHVEDLDNKVFIEEAVLKAFSKHFNWQNKEDIHFDGRNIIVKEVILKMAREIVRNDKKYAPFEILALEDEKAGFEVSIPISTAAGVRKVKMKGIIDRVDQKEGTVRVIDYKTGKDNKIFDSIDGLFERDNPKRNKAAMQTLIYTLLFAESAAHPGKMITPGLYNARELFGKDFDIRLRIKEEGVKGTMPVDDARPYFAALKVKMASLLEEIYDPLLPFAQTDNLRICSYCPYVGICHR